MAARQLVCVIRFPVLYSLILKNNNSINAKYCNTKNIMALAATHMRLALDMAHGYPVKDLSQYISGTIYPDSRWLTGIDRNLTHGHRFLQKDFPKNDFTYGWHVHCLVDHVQARLYKPLFPNAGALDRQQRWILLSAAKVIQDRHDLNRFDLQNGIDLLNSPQAPAGEDIQLVREFSRLIHETYKDRDKDRLPDYYNLWTGVGLEAKVVAKVMNQVEKLLVDISLVSKIEATYAQMAASPLFTNKGA